MCRMSDETHGIEETKIPVVIVLTAFIGILTVVVFWGVEMARGMSQSPGRRADEDAGG
jgi:hypothetical protein